MTASSRLRPRDLVSAELRALLERDEARRKASRAAVPAWQPEITWRNAGEAKMAAQLEQLLDDPEARLLLMRNLEQLSPQLRSYALRLVDQRRELAHRRHQARGAAWSLAELAPRALKRFGR